MKVMDVQSPKIDTSTYYKDSYDMYDLTKPWIFQKFTVYSELYARLFILSKIAPGRHQESFVTLDWTRDAFWQHFLILQTWFYQ